MSAHPAPATAPPPPPAPPAFATRYGYATAWITGAVFSAVVVLLIIMRPGIEAVWDQTFIGYQFSAGYPHFETGIVSHLLVGAVNGVRPFDPVVSNTIIRALAALLFVGSAALLAWSLTGTARLWAFFAFMLLVVSARFPFLWLSSELFAAAFMMLMLWSIVRGQSIALTGLFLVLFSLSKADLALPGALVGIYMILRSDPVPRWRRAAVLGGMAAVLVVPSLLFASSYYGQFGGRTWVSFGQHYGELVRILQIEPAPPGWGAWVMYLDRAFPGANSVAEAALSNPRQYLYFVSLSLAESSIRLVLTKLLLLIPIAAWFFAGMRKSWRIIVLLLLTSVIPIVLLSFLHVRYQTRLYPLALFIIFAGLRDGVYSRRQERVLMIALAVILAWQLIDLVPVLHSAHWLPD
jgi:hypothetical protein